MSPRRVIREEVLSLVALAVSTTVFAVYLGRFCRSAGTSSVPQAVWSGTVWLACAAFCVAVLWESGRQRVLRRRRAVRPLPVRPAAPPPVPAPPPYVPALTYAYTPMSQRPDPDPATRIDPAPAPTRVQPRVETWGPRHAARLAPQENDPVS